MNKNNNKFTDNPESKRVIFFVFYFVFFLIVVLLLRGANANNNSNRITSNNSGYSKSFNFDKLKNNNYHFIYKLDKNSNITIYEGDNDSITTTFVMSGNPSLNYYSKNNLYYVKNINTLMWESATNPIEFYKLIDFNTLDEIMKRATYMSRTEYLSGDEVDYNYEVSTATLIKYLDNNTISEVGDNLNNFIFHVDSNDVLYQIDMDISSYYKYYHSDINRYFISLKYSKIGEISNIRID